MGQKRNLLLAAALTVFLTAMLVTVGMRVRTNSPVEAAPAEVTQPAQSTQARTTQAPAGVDPVVAAQEIKRANQQIEQASQTIEELQTQVADLQKELDTAYATMEDREQQYQALLEQRMDPETAQAIQEKILAYEANEQQGVTPEAMTQLQNQNAELRAQLDEAYRVMKEREVAYQAQLQQAYAQLQAAYGQQQPAASSSGDASPIANQTDEDDDHNEEHEGEEHESDEHEEHEHDD